MYDIDAQKVALLTLLAVNDKTSQYSVQITFKPSYSSLGKPRSNIFLHMTLPAVS